MYYTAAWATLQGYGCVQVRSQDLIKGGGQDADGIEFEGTDGVACGEEVSPSSPGVVFDIKMVVFCAVWWYYLPFRCIMTLHIRHVLKLIYTRVVF